MSAGALAVIFAVVESFAAHCRGIAFLANAAVAIAYTGYALSHGAAECSGLAFVGESWLEWAIAGDRVRGSTFAGNFQTMIMAICIKAAATPT